MAMAATKIISDIRRALADYMRSEGCSCCRDFEKHEEAAARLAKLLRVPRYSDGSGFDFERFTTDFERFTTKINPPSPERGAKTVP